MPMSGRLMVAGEFGGQRTVFGITFQLEVSSTRMSSLVRTVVSSTTATASDREIGSE